MKSYLIIYNDNRQKYIEADDLKDCIFQFADYIEDNTDLFGKAMKGCVSVEDCVEMYEKFSLGFIYNIYEVKDIIYQKKV